MGIFAKTKRAAVAAMSTFRSDQPPPEWWGGSDGGARLFAGGPARAMKEATVFRCVKAYTGHIIQMPIQVMDGMKPVLDDEMLPLLNERPSSIWNAPEFWERMVGSILLYGDGFARIVRQRTTMMPVALVPYHPDCVTIVRQRLRGGSAGRFLQYHMTSQDGPGSDTGRFRQSDVLHFKGSLWRGDGGDYRSQSVLSAALPALGFKAAMDKYASGAYSSGLLQQFVIKTRSKPSDIAQMKHIKEWVKANHGGLKNSNFPLLIGKDDDIRPLTVTPRDGMLLELEEFRSIEIAKAFGVPNAMLNLDPKAGQGKTTAELVRLFLRTSVAELLRRIEAELNAKLPLRGRAQFDTSGVLRADPQARAAAISTALGGQPWMTVNEAREREGLPSLPDAEYDMVIPMPGSKPELGGGDVEDEDEDDGSEN